tara:strand:+ start:138 stop:533 length:396 start_codon:yes stop_codon:yes gene_type:complete
LDDLTRQSTYFYSLPKAKNITWPRHQQCLFYGCKRPLPKLKGQGKAESFATYTERNVDYVLEAIGNKDLMDYELSNGGVFRDWLTEKVTASSSVKRVFSTIRAITNLAIADYSLHMSSAFTNVYFPELGDT